MTGTFSGLCLLLILSWTLMTTLVAADNLNLILHKDRTSSFTTNSATPRKVYLWKDTIVAEAIVDHTDDDHDVEFIWKLDGIELPVDRKKRVVQIDLQKYKEANGGSYPSEIAVTSGSLTVSELFKVVDAFPEIDGTICIFPSSTSPHIIWSDNNCVNSDASLSFNGFYPLNTLTKYIFSCTISFADDYKLKKSLGDDYVLYLSPENVPESTSSSFLAQGTRSYFYAPFTLERVYTSYVCVAATPGGIVHQVSKPIRAIIEPPPSLVDFENARSNITQSHLENAFWTANVTAALQEMELVASLIDMAPIDMTQLVQDLYYLTLGVSKKLIGANSAWNTARQEKVIRILSACLPALNFAYEAVQQYLSLVSDAANSNPMLPSTFDVIVETIQRVNLNLHPPDKIANSNQQQQQGQSATDKAILDILKRAVKNKLLSSFTALSDDVVANVGQLRLTGSLSFDAPGKVFIDAFQLGPRNVDPAVPGPFISIVSIEDNNPPLAVNLMEASTTGPSVPGSQFYVEYSVQNSQGTPIAKEVTISSSSNVIFTASEVSTGTVCRSAFKETVAYCRVTPSGPNRYLIQIKNATTVNPGAGSGAGTGTGTGSGSGTTPDEDPMGAAAQEDKIKRRNIAIAVSILIMTGVILFIILVVIKIILCFRRKKNPAPNARSTNTNEPTYEIEVQETGRGPSTKISIRWASTPGPNKAPKIVDDTLKKRSQTPYGNRSYPDLE